MTVLGHLINWRTTLLFFISSDVVQDHQVVMYYTNTTITHLPMPIPHIRIWMRSSRYMAQPWSPLVEGDECCIDPSVVNCCVNDKHPNMYSTCCPWHH